MRRYLPVILFFLILGLPFVVQRFVRPTPPAVDAAGTVRLTILTSHNQDIRNEFAYAFDRWHRQHYGKAAELIYLTPGGGGEMRRFLESTYADRITDGNVDPDFRAAVDLIWGGGDFFFNVEIRRFLQPVDLPQEVLAEAFATRSLAGVRLYDFGTLPDGTPQRPRWIGICLSSFGIVYNSEVFSVLGLPTPRTWSDLARPELAGWVAMANPASSSSAAVAYSMVLQRAMADEEAALLQRRPDLRDLTTAQRMRDPEYLEAIQRGWRTGNGTLLLIAANARYFTASGTQPPGDVASGEAAVGMAIDFFGRVYEETVGRHRIRFFEPPAATAFNPDPIGIALGVRGEQFVLANRFIRFLLTPEAQTIWIGRPGTPNGPRYRALRRPPIRIDLYDDTSTWTDPELNPFTTAGDFNRRSEWDRLFTDTRQVWAAAWIDSREQLKAAYRAVLAIPEGPRREELLRAFATFPLTYADVEAIQAERRAQPERKLAEWRARKRVEMARLFRAHFASVERQARAEVAAR